MADCPIIAFDPGATTGFATLSEDGRVLFTRAIVIDELEGFLEFLNVTGAAWVGLIDIVIEIGPQFEHHSPVTRRVEAKLRSMFPEAYLIQPSQWKSHPASRGLVLRHTLTAHEKDAARLARWFQVRREDEGENTTRTNAGSSRRKRH